ncbi:MAG: GNAT family N-acetyltransferase [Caldicoprobacterales bacterium]
MRVSSSPYAVEIYKMLDFVPDSCEQIVDGIRFTLMTYIK